MSVVVPKEINYSPKNALPAGTKNTQIVVAPSNGQTFSAGQIVYFDLPSTGYLVPESLILRYKATISNATAADAIKATPAYTPFARLDTLIGAQIVESIQQYNLVAHMLVNTKMSVAQKWGQGYSLGLSDSAAAFDPKATSNSRTVAIANNQVFNFAVPLGCLLSNCENLVPLGMMPAVRIQLTLDSLANMLFAAGANVTASSFTNFELVFDDISFGEDVDAIVRAQADGNGILTLKSQSYAVAAQTIANGATGTMELVYNQRLSSIKTAVASFGKSNKNTFLDSVDVTAGGGDYQFLIAGTAYPQRPLSVYLNKAGIFAELCQCWSPAHDVFSNPTSIMPSNFDWITNNNTTAVSPGMFWVGTNLERLQTNGALLSGISSQLSPISLRINFGTGAAAEAHTAYLILCYDALLQLDINSRQCSVKQ